MRTKFLQVLLFLVFLLSGCVNTGPSLDQIATGPDIDPGFQGVSKELTENERQRLIKLLPTNMQPLHDRFARLYVADGFTSTTVVEESTTVVSVAWDNRDVGLDSDGLYLRVRNRPFDRHDCPSSGEPLDTGVTVLDSADGYSHPLRRFYAGSSGLIDWDLTMPAVSAGDRYYFQGCVLNGLRQFTGEHTNIVEIEVVRALSDLYVQSAGITTDREVWALIGNRQYFPDIRGDAFAYEISAIRSDGLGIRHNMNATSTLNLLDGAFVESGAALRIPDDGEEYQVSIRINTDRGIIESNYDNNERTIIARAVSKPAILVFSRLHVRENCDARSPGDWRMRFHVTVDTKEWRVLSSHFDVDDDTSYPLTGRTAFQVFGLEHVPDEGIVGVSIAFEDCDLLTAGCGEEWHEHPFGSIFSSEGTHQDTGWTGVNLNSFHRSSGETLSTPAMEGECGDTPFTAYFRLMEPEQAEEEGLLIDCALTERNRFGTVGRSETSVCE